jgi:choline dehydrogenase
MSANEQEAEFDYVVVGSGAGGGPLAANLAEAGQRVLLIEAGSDGENYHYQVPAFHGHATEDPEYAWEFFVRHYADDGQQRRDGKYVAARDGVLYPRAGTLGGCTAHNAMITVAPHNADWDHIAESTGDASWSSENMRQYFERFENCQYARRPWPRPNNRWLARMLTHIPVLAERFQNTSRHGFDGWLTTTMADPALAITDSELLDVIISAARKSLTSELGSRALDGIEDLVLGDPEAYVDPNDWEVATRSDVGLWLIPVAIRNGKRNGTRERIKDVQRRLPDKLVVRTNCLASRVLLSDQTCTGVEYLEGAHAYQADPRSRPARSELTVRQVHAKREVILAGGAFNTPQLLMLSGVGPAKALRSVGIEPRIDLPGVGENLQDRYEVGVVTEMTRDFSLTAGWTFDSPIPGQPLETPFQEWLRGSGLYATNGAVLGIIKKSNPDRALPDLFLFGLPASFRGYYPGYAKELELRRNLFTWAVLKGHTNNIAGRVALRSSDPTDVPAVNFHYFDEGSDASGDDLDSVVSGVEFARKLMSHASEHVRREVVPGPDVTTRDEIASFVRDQAWGHHASCTCKMGPPTDPTAVVDSRFRVHGTQGLRVVDASVFPRIPGFFIVAAVYTLAEKATDVILEDRGPNR